MPTNVVMPQMGESIAEGTIVRWIKKIGDAVDRDEPLFEISTDKVDAEIPSPAAGVLTDIKAKEGDTVPVNSVVAVIGGDSVTSAQATTKEPVAAPAPGSLPEAAAGQPETPGGQKAAKESVETHPTESGSKDDLRRQKSSPLVRRIAQEHHVDIAQIHGTGISGRVTKQDILDYINGGGGERVAAGEPPEAAAGAPAVDARTAPATPGPTYKPGERVSVVPMSVMRKKIAEHMVLSAHTSPHVYSASPSIIQTNS